MKPILTVDDLRVTFPTRTGAIEAVRGVSFTLGRERLGIVGESGSGKSQTGRAIMGLTPPHAQITAKTLQFDGIDLLDISDQNAAPCAAVALPWCFRTPNTRSIRS